MTSSSGDLFAARLLDEIVSLLSQRYGGKRYVFYEPMTTDLRVPHDPEWQPSSLGSQQYLAFDAVPLGTRRYVILARGRSAPRYPVKEVMEDIFGATVLATASDREIIRIAKTAIVSSGRDLLHSLLLAKPDGTFFPAPRGSSAAVYRRIGDFRGMTASSSTPLAVVRGHLHLVPRPIIRYRAEAIETLSKILIEFFAGSDNRPTF